MTNEELEEYLTKIDKKLTKLLTLNTRIAKSLHLLPVTEKEERSIQIQQRTNLQLASKVSKDLDEMSPKKDESVPNLSDGVLYILEQSEEDVYSDVIGNDFLGG